MLPMLLLVSLATAPTAAALPASDITVSRSYTRPAPCLDPLAETIARAGWTGRDARIAWAIAQRESNGDPTTEWGGAYGLFQIQASAWEGTDYWPANPYDADENAAAAYRLWDDYGWMPWGINDDGTGMDLTQYGGWDEETQQAWIWEPFSEYFAAYPCDES